MIYTWRTLLMHAKSLVLVFVAWVSESCERQGRSSFLTSTFLFSSTQSSALGHLEIYRALNVINDWTAVARRLIPSTMADYNKQTVAQLRQMLKDRSIPSTGLTRKAQIVEKLEEADNTSTEAPEPSNAIEDAAPGAEEPAQLGEQTAQEEDVPGPPLAEAGGMFELQGQVTNRADPYSEPAQTAAEAETESEPTLVPAPTADRSPETISHIESDVPPPNETKAIEQPAEDTTMEEETGGPQPIQIFRAAPADPEDVVGPHVTEPTDKEAEVEAKEEETDVAQDKLPQAPGPAAEALRLAQPEPEQQEDTQDTAMEVETPSPAPDEKVSVEKPELLPIPEGSTAGTSRLPTEELEADTRKRKRRSNSPDLTTKEILAKKLRLSQEPAPEIHLKEDDNVVMEQPNPENSLSNTKGEKKENTSRYKDLVQSAPTSLDTPTDDRPTIPAIHPVTSALYIRNFMRPLRLEPLRTHLTSLASPPSSSPDPSIITALFLDNMKTHALALFTSTTAASRVRASLHGSIWPPEGNRKELWVDFVPSDRVEQWIKTEEDAAASEKEARTSGRPVPAKRFEVVYTETENSATATHQELGSSAPLNAPRGPRASVDDRRPATVPVPTEELKKDTSASFKTLHDLFDSTAAKPQLFYLPVSDAVADVRLRELDAETSRDWDPEAVRKGRGMQKEARFRYTFEEDRVVEAGEDREGWAGDERGARGGFRGRGGWRGRGAWRA